MKYRESEEMYLETLLVLKAQGPYVRGVDVANKLGYTKPSVSRGMKLLKAKGYITINAGNIILTESGRARAEKIYDRHKTITKFFISLGADEKSAEDNACKIEHVISDDIFKVIKQKVQN